MICPQCGYENKDGTSFCVRCGTALRATTGQPGAARYEGGTPASPGPSAPPNQPPPAYGYSQPPAAQPPPAYGYSTGSPPASPYGSPPSEAQPPIQDLPESARLAGAPPPVPPRRSHLLRNVLVAVALLVVVGGSAVAYLAYQALNKPNIAATKLIPADAYGYITVAAQATGTQKASLDKLQDAFKSQLGFQAAWDKIFTQASDMGSPARSVLGDCGDGTATPGAAGTPTPAADVSQYLGDNVTLAMLSLSKDEAAQFSQLAQGGGDFDMGKTLTSKILVFVDLDFNPLNKKGLVRTLAEQKDKGTGPTMPLVETYREVEIHKLVTPQCGQATGTDGTPATPDIYLALLGGTAVVTLDPAPLHGVIDRYKDNKGSLQDSPAFQALDSELPKDRLMTFYINLTAVYDTIQTAMPISTNETSTQVKMTRTDGASEIVVTAHDDGLQIDGSTDAQVDGQAMGSTAVPAADTLNDIPAGSWLFYSGTDLKTSIEQALALYRKQGMSDTIDKGMADIKDNLGIDVEKDLLPLLGGDYALSMQGQKGDAGLNFSALLELHLKSGEGGSMNSVVDTLNQHMADQNGQATAVPVGNASLWSSPVFPPVLYGVAGDKFYLLGNSDMANETASADTARAVLDGQGKGIGTDATVRERLKHLPDKSTATLYVDLGKIRTDGIEPLLTDGTTTPQPDAEAAMPAFGAPSRTDYNETIAPFLKPLQYILSGGATSVRNNMTHTRSVVFLGIGK